MTAINFSNFPDARGHFGVHGGRFVSETLMAALLDLEKLYARLKDDPQFRADFDKDLAFYVGRPSPLYHAERWSRELGGAQIYLKREDLNHTGAHKVNNTIGQALLAKHGQVNMALPPQLSLLVWAWSVWCIWVKKTLNVKPPMFIV